MLNFRVKMNRLSESFEGLRGIENLPSNARKRLDRHIRVKAVAKAEEKMILSDKPKENYTEDQKQFLIASCEEKILQDYKKGGFKLVFIALGLPHFL